LTVRSLTNCPRAGGCAVFNYPFLTQKERDNETGLDYFLARYYSSTEGRFTSPDEFTGGPDELYYFVDDASANPTFYADLRKPQSLNKYQYSFNNPLRYVDPDGHDPEEPEPQDPKPVVPVPVPIGPGMPITLSPSTPGPSDQQIIRGVESVLDTVTYYTGIDRLADWLRPKIWPTPAPTTGTPPQSPAQPMPPPPPAEAGHRKGKRKSTEDKHEAPRPGRPNTKDRQNPDWRPRQRPKDWPKKDPWPPWKTPKPKDWPKYKPWPPEGGIK
jgi:RHS repeat-associated protein